MRTRAAELLEQALREGAAFRKPGEIYKSDHDGFRYAQSKHGDYSLGPFNSHKVAQHAVEHEHEIEAKRTATGDHSLRGCHWEPDFKNSKRSGVDQSKASRAKFNDGLLK